MAREFWIHKSPWESFHGDTDREFDAFEQKQILEPEDNFVHVIEYTAYQKALDALREIQKQRFGAQGYYEEEDWKGLADYYAKIILEHENKARAVLKELEG